jgi:DNA/RNA endonuclease G (NUC1)
LDDNGIENSGVGQALYDKGHMVPDLAMAEQFGADPQTYSMCNVGPQTSSLNAHKWKSLEAMVNCVGKQKELIVLGGPLPAFQEDPAGCLKGGGEFNDELIHKSTGSSGGLEAWPTKRDFVPEGYWKVIYDVGRKLTFVYLYNNDFMHASCAFQFTGKKGMEVIEAATGFTFPKVLKKTFGESHEDFVSEAVDCKASNFKTDECEDRSAPGSQ